jgi:hypothetical protein
MNRDHSAAAWTPDWLGETPGTVDEHPARPAHAAPEPNAETRELIDLDAFEQAEFEELKKRPLVSEGWAEERGATRPGADPGVGSLRSLGAVAVTGRRPTRPPKAPRPGHLGRTGSARGLVALVLLALLAAFFAWVTAEPLWLAVGHSTQGSVTVTRCADDRCLGTFTSPAFTRDAVPVMGDVPDPGASTPALMTSQRGGRAYADVDFVSRAALGVALILLCGLGIIRATGIRHLPNRRTPALLSLGGPLLLLAAMLAVTY